MVGSGTVGDGLPDAFAPFAEPETAPAVPDAAGDTEAEPEAAIMATTPPTTTTPTPPASNILRRPSRGADGPAGAALSASGASVTSGVSASAGSGSLAPVPSSSAMPRVLPL